GRLGGGVYGPVVAPDRPAAGGQYGLLGWLAGLERTRLQEHQRRRLAVAASPHAAARAGGAPVAGHRRGHAVVAARRGPGRRDAPGRHGPGRHGPRPPAGADAACHAPAAGACLSSWLDPDPGGVARPGATASGPLPPRTLARRPGAGRGAPLPAGPGTAPGCV